MSLESNIERPRIETTDAPAAAALDGYPNGHRCFFMSKRLGG
jgi:hypothetical protein